MDAMKPKYVPDIICPHCGGKFSVTEITGSWMARRCPKCGRTIAPSDFDRLVETKRSEQRALAIKRDRHQDLRRRHGKIAEFIVSPIFAPMRFLIAKKALWHGKMLDRINDKRMTIANEIALAAMNRYYASEWYLCSGAALRNDSHPLGSYELVASYDKNGRFSLRQGAGDLIAGGMLGEWRVFESLAEHICPNGMLEGTRLVPNAFLPSSLEDEPGFKHQTDLIVLTRQGIFVCEVKNWRTRVHVQRCKGKIAMNVSERQEERPANEHDATKPLQQIEQRMKDIEALGIYPKSRIYGLAVFVDPDQFHSACNCFVGNMFVARCGDEATDTLLPAIAERVRYEEPIFTQEEVDAMADRLLENWVDRDGNMARTDEERRDQVLRDRRHERLTALADLSVDRRQAGFQKREEHGKKRDAERAKHKRAKKSRGDNSDRKRYTRNNKVDLDEWYPDDWDDMTS